MESQFAMEILFAYLTILLYKTSPKRCHLLQIWCVTSNFIGLTFKQFSCLYNHGKYDLTVEFELLHKSGLQSVCTFLSANSSLSNDTINPVFDMTSNYKILELFFFQNDLYICIYSA